MGADRTRGLVFALVSCGLIVASTLFLDWYVMQAASPLMGGNRFAIDLRSVHVCALEGACVSVPMSMLKGMYPSTATWTFWISLAFAVVVAIQTGARMLTGIARPGWSKAGYALGSFALISAVVTGFMLGPEPGSQQDLPFELAITVTRSWAPSLLVFGLMLGFVALYYSVVEDDYALRTDYDAPVLAPARTVSDPRSRIASDQLPAVGTQPIERISGPIPTVPELLRGKLNYVALTAELTRGGIDARREDGSSRLVMWRDVVGVVARRLPAIYDGLTFVDIVSTADSTLRFLPWTRLTGDPVEGEGDARVLALIALVTSRCPDAKLDPATRAFVESHGQAAQLRDLETLAAHDERLA